MKTKVYIFDFDGTLTTKDTLLEFIKYSRGRLALLWVLLLYAPLLVLMKLRLYPNGKAKQKVFAHFFKGMCVEDFNSLCRRFADDNRNRLLRPKGEQAVKRALESGAMVMVVSASVDNWVKPFFSHDEVGAVPSTEHDIRILGTQLETAKGKLTGRFSTPNCYGREKVRRIEEALQMPRANYEIMAFGDSRGDKEMLSFADKGYYKPFRR
jgi:phosphatidylglycerophosphatase C